MNLDYSQFLMMPQELGLLAVFLLVFLYDTFMPKSTQQGLPLFATIAFGIFMIFGFFPVNEGLIFEGMFQADKATWAIKNILNMGTFIVLLQAVKWANSDFVAVRRGEFYELSCSPAQANTAPEGSNAVHQPVFSMESGFYDSSFTLSLSADEGCTVYYTTDGSDPLTSPTAQDYTSAITVKDRTNEPNIYSANVEDDNSATSISRPSSTNPTRRRPPASCSAPSRAKSAAKARSASFRSKRPRPGSTSW